MNNLYYLDECLNMAPAQRNLGLSMILGLIVAKHVDVKSCLANMPYILDTCNRDAVIVKDNRGSSVILQSFNNKDFLSLPEDMRKQIITQAHENAKLLVALSEIMVEANDSLAVKS